MLYEDAIDAISASTILKIGWLGEDGTILWHTNAGSIIPSPLAAFTSNSGRSRPRTQPFHPSG
jgi:hypothetical protein